MQQKRGQLISVLQERLVLPTFEQRQTQKHLLKYVKIIKFLTICSCLFFFKKLLRFYFKFYRDISKMFQFSKIGSFLILQLKINCYFIEIISKTLNYYAIIYIENFIIKCFLRQNNCSDPILKLAKYMIFNFGPSASYSIFIYCFQMPLSFLSDYDQLFTVI